MEDKHIIELYLARDENAIAETEKKYGSFCHYVAYKILQNDADADEIVNDTYLRAWDSIPPNLPEPLRGYLATIANRLALDRYEYQTAKKRGGGEVMLALDELSDCVSGTQSDIESDSVHLRDALNSFLRSLPDRTRRIFIRRYFYVCPVAEIAADFGMKESAVTVLMLRTRQKLKKFLQKEGISI